MTQAGAAARSRLPAGGLLEPQNVLKLVEEGRPLASIPGLISVERTADTTVSGQQIANFVYHVDLQKLFGSPVIANFVKAVLVQIPNGTKVNALELRLALAGLSRGAKGSTLTITRLIGITDKMPYGLGVDLAMKVDSKLVSLLGAVEPSSTPEASAQSPTLNLHFLVTLSKIGEKVPRRLTLAPTRAEPLGPSLGQDTID